MTSLRSMLLRTAAMAALVVGAAHAATFGIALESNRIALSKGVLELDFVVTPAQPNVQEITIDTLVDTTGKAVLSNLKVAGDGSKFVAKLDGANKLPAGMYKLKVSATPSSKSTSGEDGSDSATAATGDAVSEVLQLKVTVPVVVTSAEVNGLALTVGEKITTHEFSSGSGDALRIAIALAREHDATPVVAHQAFLRFTHTTNPTTADTYFVLAVDTADDAKTHATTLQFASLSKKFNYQSGVYTLQLIVGDPTFESSIVWTLGNVELQLASAPPPTPSPLYAKHLLHESDTTLTALPEIKHVMRAQDARPPIAVSLAFTGVVLVPLAAFLLFVLQLRLNARKLFGSSVFVFGAGFLASLAAILALFGWYWLELTMFRTLGYLAVLAPVNLAFGHWTLKRLASDDARAMVSSGNNKSKHD